VHATLRRAITKHARENPVSMAWRNYYDSKMDLVAHLNNPEIGGISFLLIKAQLRAAVTLPLQNVGLMFDTEFTRVDTAAQSLFGYEQATPFRKRFAFSCLQPWNKLCNKSNPFLGSPKNLFPRRSLGYRSEEEQQVDICCDRASVKEYVMWAQCNFDVARTPTNAKNMSDPKTGFQMFPPALFSMDPLTAQQFAARQHNKHQAMAYLRGLRGFSAAVYSEAALMTVIVITDASLQSSVDKYVTDRARAYYAGTTCSGPGTEGRWDVVLDARPGSEHYCKLLLGRTGARVVPMPCTTGMNSGAAQEVEHHCARSTEMFTKLAL
jgi:hypothetical protein